MKRIFMMLLCFVVAACAGVQQMVTGYESAAATAMQATDDNLVRVWTFQACATPLSAAIRNPQIIPALRALCVPSGISANPTVLLDSISTKP